MERNIKILVMSSLFTAFFTCVSFADSVFPSSVHFYAPQTNEYYEQFTYYDEYYDNWVVDESVWEEDNIKRVFVDGSSTIRSVESTDESVATGLEYGEDSGIGYDCVDIIRNGGGKCDIIIKCNDGKALKCHVTADPTPFELTKSSYTFDKNHVAYFSLEVMTKHTGSDIEFKSVSVSDPSVISVDWWSVNLDAVGDLLVLPKKPGESTVTVTAADGRTQTLDISVMKSYFKPFWKQALKRDPVYRWKNDKKTMVNIYGTPGAKITLKIGGKKYKKTLDKQGETFFRVKKKFKKGTKYTVTISKCGVKYTYKGKVKVYK